MTKKLAMLMCTAALVLGIAVPQASAAGPYYPISVEEYTAGNFDELRIDKVYQLSLSDDPSGIPTDDFERDGRRYYLLDLTRKDEVGVDTQPYTETVTMDSDTGELSEVLKRLDSQKEVTTEDGYTGVLILDHTSVKVEVKGYKTSSCNLSATRTYPNLSDADVSLVPKTVTDKGKTLTLADVQWSSDGTYYTATASYTGTASSRYATGYTVTANYTGQVSKSGCEVVTYTATFGSEELTIKDGQLSPTRPGASDVSATETGGGNWLPIMGCVGGISALVAAVVWSVQIIKNRRAKV